MLDAAALQFEPDELTRLVYAVIEINAWNRLAITVGAPQPGTYQARQLVVAHTGFVLAACREQGSPIGDAVSSSLRVVLRR